MSRFNQPSTLSAPAPDSQNFRPPEPRLETASRDPGAADSLVLAPSASDLSVAQKAGFALLCVFVISGYANEFAMRLFHGKAYISTVALAGMPLLLLVSGNLLRGLRDVIGRLWLVMLLCMCLSVPFSLWRGGSLELVLFYVAHCWIQFLVYAGFLVSLRNCRRLMFFLIASNFLLLLDCSLFGVLKDGRFEIPGSIFFTNANDLALQLLIAVTQFMYLLYQRQRWKHVVGGVAILASFLYMLKTGSRGALLAVIVLACMAVAFGKNRMRLALVGMPVALAALVFVPASALHRLALIGFEPKKMIVANMDDAAAVASQIQRMELLRQSVTYAIAHPLFGVGPGQFAVAVYGDSVKEGADAPWLGTHNSYTQVASECGIPAFLLYTSVIVLALISNFRIFRRTINVPAYGDLSALAFCTFNATLVYAICTFFFHIAYSSFLPCIAGMSVALRLNTNPSLWSGRPVGLPPNNRSLTGL
jgi:hypothetical protein